MVGDEMNKDPSLFLILCEKKLERLYALQFGDVSAECDVEFRFISDPKSFTLQCLQMAPTAGLVDLASLVRGTTEDMNRLFAFRTKWPVLRSRVGSDGSGEIMRMIPPLKGPFQETLVALAEGECIWENAGETRSNLRCAVRCRARIRIAGSDSDWSRVNIEVLSRGGCMIVASELPPVGAELEVEIRDLRHGNAHLNAEVIWAETWDDIVSVPRGGLRFSQESFPESLLEALGDPNVVTLT